MVNAAPLRIVIQAGAALPASTSTATESKVNAAKVISGAAELSRSARTAALRQASPVTASAEIVRAAEAMAAYESSLIGRITRPNVLFAVVAKAVYQATSAVAIPKAPPTWISPVELLAKPMPSTM